jgi:hypothetical protein
MRKKILITENQYKRIFLNEKTSIDDKADVKNVIDFLRSNGWPEFIIKGGNYGKNLNNCVSGNHVYAQAMLNAITELNNTYIAPKVHTGVLVGGAFDSRVSGKMDVCVSNKDAFASQTCNQSAGGTYYSEATNFSKLAEVISDKKIGKFRASDVLNNTTIYFHYSKIQKHINDSYSMNKYAFNSYLFPDGFWNYLTTYFGTTNYNQILGRVKSFSSGDLSTQTSGLNSYEKEPKQKSVWESIGDCATDYHCVLDVASIAVLAIPAVGPVVSMGLDFANAASYGIEAANANTREERNAALIAGGLTLVGGFLGGGPVITKNILTKGAANPKVYKYVDEVIERVNKAELKSVASDFANKEVVKIYKETAEKYGLNNGQILLGHDILNMWGKIDPNLAKMYSEALVETNNKITKANLIKISTEPGFQKVLIKNGGDVITSLKAYSKTKAGKEALMEAGMFVVLMEVFKIPEVAKWLSKGINSVQHTFKPTTQTTIENEGYNWKATKEIFMSNSSSKDNVKLQNAFKKGWRPWTNWEETPTQEEISKARAWIAERPEYQTDTFKSWLLQQQQSLLQSSIGGKLKKTEIQLTPKNPEERKENVRYADNQKQMDALNGNLDPENKVNQKSLLDKWKQMEQQYQKELPQLEKNEPVELQQKFDDGQ